MSRSATKPGSSMPVSAKDNGTGSLSWVRRLFPAVTRRGSLAGPFPESLNHVIILFVDILPRRRRPWERWLFGSSSER
jgi:hypothetical protein